MTGKNYSLRPLADRVVVRRLEAESKSAGGIVLPGSASEKPNRGEVVAVGPGIRLDNGKLVAPAVQVGDCILFGKYGPNEIKLNGEELLIIKESEILAIIDNTETDLQEQAA
ncbi:MAG: co-chaperone GroES [Gammaproteobacteria bacterium]